MIYILRKFSWPYDRCRLFEISLVSPPLSLSISSPFEQSVPVGVRGLLLQMIPPCSLYFPFLCFPSCLPRPLASRALSVCFVKESGLVVPQVTSSRHLLADLLLLQQLSTKLTHLIYCGVQDIALLHQ